MVKALDDAVGVVEQALRDTGRDQRAIRLVQTDNGGCTWSDGNNFPLRGHKISYWEGGTRGLAFVAAPALLGTRRGSLLNFSSLMHASDLYSTLLQAAGLPPSALPPSAIDSVPQWDAIVATASGSAPAAAAPRTSLVHHALNNGGGKVRNGSWNLYSRLAPTPAGGLTGLCNPVYDAWSGQPDAQHPSGPIESPAAPPECTDGGGDCLFDLSVDVAERHNVAQQQPEVLASHRTTHCIAAAIVHCVRCAQVVAALRGMLAAATCAATGTSCRVDAAPAGCGTAQQCDVLARDGCFGPFCD
jgi:arylsulfatase I/J